MNTATRLARLERRVGACPQCHGRPATVASDIEGPLIECCPMCGEPGVITTWYLSVRIRDV